MNSADPIRSGEQELEDETVKILAERDLSFEEDKRTAVDAREALREIRAKLRHPAPR